MSAEADGKIYYTGVRKMRWDALWHALFTNPKGRESWDRVTERRALSIARRLMKGKGAAR